MYLYIYCKSHEKRDKVCSWVTQDRYNSAIFARIVFYQYSVFLVTKDFTTKEAFDLNFSSDAFMSYDWAWTSLLFEKHKFVQKKILWLQNHISTLNRFENLECINTYLDVLSTTRSNVLIVVFASKTENQTLLEHHEVQSTAR